MWDGRTPRGRGSPQDSESSSASPATQKQQRTLKSGQKAHEEGLSVVNPQGNANRDHTRGAGGWPAVRQEGPAPYRREGGLDGHLEASVEGPPNSKDRGATGPGSLPNMRPRRQNGRLEETPHSVSGRQHLSSQTWTAREARQHDGKGSVRFTRLHARRVCCHVPKTDPPAREDAEGLQGPA